jgi:hypothetical protein
MPKVRLIVLAFGLAACAPNAASSSFAPGPSIAPSVTAATSAPSDITAPSAPSVSDSPGPSGACIDRGQLAETADSVNTSLQGMAAALTANNAGEASALAGAAATQMRSLAGLVEAVRPAAATGLRNAADKLDRSKANLADATAAGPVVQTLFGEAYDQAMAGACPA